MEAILKKYNFKYIGAPTKNTSEWVYNGMDLIISPLSIRMWSKNGDLILMCNESNLADKLKIFFPSK